MVRALVQSAGATLATAMASASEIEIAEDRAKSRALEAIGMTAGAAFATVATAPLPNLAAEDSSVIPKAGSSLDAAFKQTNPSSPAAESPFSAEAPPIHLPEPTKSLPYSASLNSAASSPAATSISRTTVAAHLDGDSSEAAFSSELSSDWSTDLPMRPSASTATAATAVSTPVSVPAASEADVKTKPEATATKADKPGKRKAESASAPRDLSDRSEEIMKIGIEMKRLGWSTEQGREYLKRTYGKRSRQELDEAELLDFLHYLETQPSPLQTPF